MTEYELEQAYDEWMGQLIDDVQFGSGAPRVPIPYRAIPGPQFDPRDVPVFYGTHGKEFDPLYQGGDPMLASGNTIRDRIGAIPQRALAAGTVPKSALEVTKKKMNGNLSPLDMLGLPLSAYTPGQGDLAMEGKVETASGAPMYFLEDYLAGLAPYVTAALTGKGSKPTGEIVMRTLGDYGRIPFGVTDRGPGIAGRPPGLDIATRNPAWATSFPYQGAVESAEVGGTPYGRPSVPLGYPQPAGASAPGGPQMSTMAQYDAMKAADQRSAFGTGAGAVGAGIETLLTEMGGSMQKGGADLFAKAGGILGSTNPALQAAVADPLAPLRAMGLL